MWTATRKSLLVASLLLAVVTVNAQEEEEASVPTLTEREILLELYKTTGGDNWGENYGWSENLDDICDWHGVLCHESELSGRRKTSSSSSHVKGLKLSSNTLVGRTPDSLWKLSHLQELDLSYNNHLEVTFTGLDDDATTLQVLRLHDTATTTVTGLSAAQESLTVLQLSKNKLNSQIPAELFALTKLSTLSLAECNVQGTLPSAIQKLSQLHELNLFDNALTGRLPETMSRLVHLRKLSMSYNQFQGTIPTFVNDFTRLQQFWAVANDFTGNLPSFSEAPDLVKLDVQHNNLEGNFPSNFLDGVLSRTDTTAKITVDIRHNSMGAIVPESLQRLHRVPMHWYLGDNEFQGFEVEQLCFFSHWNGGILPQIGCSGILCPMGQFSATGAATLEEGCLPCPSLVDNLGATNCFDKDDKSVLSELYAATGGSDWVRADGWLQEDNVCDWYGVVCWEDDAIKTGYVRRVVLRNNNLQGKLPDTIYSMQYLTTIDISQNPNAILSFLDLKEASHMYSINVAGTNTQSLDGLEEATDFFHELWADGLNLQGPIPAEIFQATSLRRLSMQDCGFSGSLDGNSLLNMGFLEELYLSDNNLDGNIPDIFDSGLDNLSILALAKNAFRGPLPSTWDTAPALKAVTVFDQSSKGGGITGQLLPFSTTQTLSRLLLGENELEGTIPDNLLASIEASTPITVDLSHNTLTGGVPEELERFDRLNLYLEGNFISELPDRLCRQNGWMNGNVEEYGCDAILCPKGTMGGRRQYTDGGCTPCPERITLEIVDGDTASGLDVLYFGQPTCGDRAEDLTERDILALLHASCGGIGWHSDTHWLSEKSVCEWYGVSCDDTGSITSIALGNNQLVGALPTEIFMLPNLQQLKLYSNTIYFDWEGIANAKNLRSLSLDDTGLETLKGVGAARSLRELNVADNSLEGPIPEEISRLVHLESLTMSNNKLNGYLPYWMRSLRSIRTISISDNQLEGPLYDFADFDELVYLDLSYNRLSGDIPVTFLGSVDSEAKVVADLAHNRLSGTVPNELSRLEQLTMTLKENRITAVHADLCDVDGWNNADVGEFGCDGILCPVGTYSPSRGRQSSDDSPCEPCKGAKYMGSTTCAKSAASARYAGLMATLAAASASMWMWMVL